MGDKQLISEYLALDGKYYTVALGGETEFKQQFCPCGGIILADTEDWRIPLCYECYIALGGDDFVSNFKTESI